MQNNQGMVPSLKFSSTILSSTEKKNREKELHQMYVGETSFCFGINILK